MTLPLLFVIGDSISGGYGPHLERFLRGVFRYDHRTGTEPDVMQGKGCNSGDVLRYVQARAADAMWRPRWVLLNCGLHDLKTDPASGKKEVPLDEYRRNISAVLEGLGRIGSRVVWVRTTPVDDERHNSRVSEFHRFARDVEAYNAAADTIMSAANVPVIDLHGFALAMEGEVFCNHVHFVPAAAELQAAFIAGALAAMLRQFAGQP